MNEPATSAVVGLAANMRIFAAVALYAVGIMVLLLNADAPIAELSIGGLVVAGLAIWLWSTARFKENEGNHLPGNTGLALAVIGFLTATVATLVGMDLAVTGSGFVTAAAGMCLGAVKP